MRARKRAKKWNIRAEDMGKLRTAREGFVEDAAVILEHRLKCALGEDPVLKLADICDTHHETIVRDLMDMIKQIGETNVLDAKSTSDVIGLLAKGRITIIDAERLMTVMQRKTEIDEIPALRARLEELENHGQ